VELRKFWPMDMVLPLGQFQKFQKMDVHPLLQYGYGYPSTDKIGHVVFVSIKASFWGNSMEPYTGMETNVAGAQFFTMSLWSNSPRILSVAHLIRS
jgi:hypothetical protein